MTATGHDACIATRWLIEPSIRLANPPRPRLPSTSSPASAVSAISRAAGLPTRMSISQFRSGLISWASATPPRAMPSAALRAVPKRPSPNS
jgi:hypothetical protein